MISSARSFSPPSWFRPLGYVILFIATFGVILGGMASLFAIQCTPDRTVLTCLSSGNSFIALFVASSYVICGMWLMTARRPAVEIFFCCMVAFTLAVGSLSRDWAYLFYIGMSWLTVLVFFVHFNLLERQLQRVGAIITSILALVAVIGTIPAIFLTFETMEAMGILEPWRIFVRLGLLVGVICTLVMLGVLVRSPSIIVRRRGRQLTTGILLAVLPLLLLSVVPTTFRASTFVSFNITFWGLLIHPLTYYYTLVGYRSSRLNRWLEQALATYIVFWILVGLLILRFEIGTMLVIGQAPFGGWFPFELAYNLILIFAVVPAWWGLRRFTRWLLYGRDVDYKSFADRIVSTLSLLPDRREVNHLLVDEMATMLQLSHCALFIRNSSGGMTLAQAVGYDAKTLHPLSVVQGLLGVQVTEISAADHPTDARPVWVPFVAGGAVHGALVVGARPADDIFTPEDFAFFSSLTYPVGVALHNLELVEEVRASRNDLAKAHQELLVARERERLSLAQELHDGALQDLLSLAYRLGTPTPQPALTNGQGAVDPAIYQPFYEARERLLSIASQLRGFVRELRPAGLSELGVTAAIQGYLSSLERTYGENLPEFEVDMDDLPHSLPEAISLTLFRVVQEAVRNAVEHADAEHINIFLRRHDDEVVAVVRDDGTGFTVPPRLSEFARDNHFGLVGMTERVNYAQGKLTLESAPGRGTSVKIRVPLTPTDAMVAVTP